MASSCATMTSSATCIPLGHLFPLPPATDRKLRIVADKVAAFPEQGTASDLQSPISKFLSGRSRSEYPAGGCIFSQGEPANAVFYIQSGKVRLSVVSMNGKEAVIAHLPAGSFFGEASLAGETVRGSSANALLLSNVIRIDKTAMQDLLQREPSFGQFFAHLLTRNMRMQADLVDHLFNSSEKRLARLLMLMANFGQETKPIPVIAKISQETLAEMIGTTRSRVSFLLNRFRDLGYIDYDGGGMLIDSSLVNVVLHD